MFRRCFFRACALAAWLSVVSVAFGQYGQYGQYSGHAPVQANPYNPFNGISGFAGGQLQQLYNQTVASSGGPSLNQMALRNAQAAATSPQPSGMEGAARIGLGTGTSLSGNKPFTGYSTGPTVSPYLNLFRVDLAGNNALNYNTLVAPQLQQQQVNQQLSRQTSSTERRLQAIAAQAEFNPQGSKEEPPTGHQTVFMYFGHYYQTPQVHHKPTARQQ